VIAGIERRLRMNALRQLLVLSGAVLLCACSSTPQVISGSGGASISQSQERAATDLPRIAVGAIIDKTNPASDKSIARQLMLVNALHPDDPVMTPDNITHGVRDMLTTALFNSNRFIVLERDAINDAMVEQEFSQSSRAGDATRIPLGQLEGAQLLVVGAITAFDAGVGGGSIPIPIPLSRNGNFGIMNVSAKRGYVAMDLRVIDVATGRVVSSTAVEGKNWHFGMDFTGVFGFHGGAIALPGLLKYFSNTPVEEALQKMVDAAVDQIVQKAP
jgi:curli biogenesis system outer membrane secretion channel CsgG